MKITYCDRCGKAISDDVRKYVLEITDNDFTSETYQCVIHTRDLCEHCKTHIEHQCRYDKLEKE